MRKSGTGVQTACAVIASISLALIGNGASRAEQPSTQPDWQARFFAQAPAEYARLEAAVSRWEIRYIATDTHYPNDGSRRVTRTFSNQVQIVFDDRLGGVRHQSATLALGPGAQPGVTVFGRNPEYTFQVDSEKNERFLISQYAGTRSGQDEHELWTEQLEKNRGIPAEDFDGASLLRLLESGEVKLKSVSTVDLDGKTCVRFDCDRVFKLSASPGVHFPGWVVIDPAFHWAVLSYEQHDPTGGIRRGSNKYNPRITDVAFPRQIVQEDFGFSGRPAMRIVMDFEDPQPSHAMAKDFTLESFGLERPASPAQQRKRNIMLMVLINGGLILALVLLFVLYRRRKPGPKWVSLRAGR